MMTRRVAVLSILLFGIASSSNASKPSASKEQKTDSLPKIVTVSYKNGAEYGNVAILADVQIRKLGSRDFLVGKMIFVGDQTELVGKIKWIPLDSVVRMVEYFSEKDAIDTTKKLLGEYVEKDDSSEHKPSAIPWRTDYNAARKEAEEKKLPLLIFFDRDNCKPCIRLDRAINEHAELEAYLKTQTVPLRIDGLKENVLARRLGIDAYPTLVIADLDGRIRANMVGYQDPEGLLGNLKATFKPIQRPMMPYAKD